MTNEVDKGRHESELSDLEQMLNSSQESAAQSEEPSEKTSHEETNPTTNTDAENIVSDPNKKKRASIKMPKIAEKALLPITFAIAASGLVISINSNGGGNASGSGLSRNEVETIIRQYNTKSDNSVETIVNGILANKENADKQQLMTYIDTKFDSLKVNPDIQYEQLDINKDVQPRIDTTVKEQLAKYSNNFDYRIISFSTKYNESLTSLSKRISDLENGKFVRDEHVLPRERLHGFNVMTKIVDGVYSLRAPDKAGKPNYITLQKGERFRDIRGIHVVNDIIVEEGKPKYLIDDRFFIDNVREDYTKEDLDLLNVKASAVKSDINISRKDDIKEIRQEKHVFDESGKSRKNESTVPTTNVTPIESKQSPALLTKNTNLIQKYKDGRVLLPKWQVVMQSDDLQSALVVDGSLNNPKPIELRLNQYQSYFGTVTDIESDGTVCSDRFCIGHLK